MSRERKKKVILAIKAVITGKKEVRNKNLVLEGLYALLMKLDTE